MNCVIVIVFYIVTSLIILSLLLMVFQEQHRKILKLQQKFILEEKLNIDNETLKWLAVYNPPSIAVLVHSCGNPVVSRLIEQLIAYRSSKDELVVIVFQHCWHEKTVRQLKSFGNEIYLVQGSDITLPNEYVETAYNHFWAFNLTFQNLRFENAVVLGDSFKISPDFQSYFEVTIELLENDPSLWCVSGYNDNGKEHLIDTTKLHGLYRTDFFSGIAWMTSKTKWKEFGAKEWPKVYFYDWIRKQTVTKTLACIRPEISRVKFILDESYDDQVIPYKIEDHLDNIYLNSVSMEIPREYLDKLIKHNYDRWYMSTVLESHKIDLLDYLNKNQTIPFLTLRINYNNEEEFTNIAERLGIMSDVKDGVPRNSYKGIVTTMHESQRIDLTPNSIEKIQSEVFDYK